MNPRLIPLLVAYDEGPPIGTPVPVEPAAAVEEALLRTTRAALDAMERPAPPRSAVEAVMQAARESAASSELASVRAVMAGDDADDSTETALLRTTWDAVTRTKRPGAPASALAAVEAAARDLAAQSDLAPLRAVLAGAPVAGAGAAEAELLRTTLAALDGLPRMSPPADAVVAATAAAGRAARASGLGPLRAALAGDADSHDPETRLLDTTWQAVERAPREGPPLSAVQAVLVAAHAAVPAPLREAHAAAARAADRPAARRSSSFYGFAYLTAALALAGLVSVSLWMTANGPRGGEIFVAELDESPSAAPLAGEAEGMVANAEPLAAAGPLAAPLPATPALAPAGAAPARPIALQEPRDATPASRERLAALPPAAPPPPPPQAAGRVDAIRADFARPVQPTASQVGLVGNEAAVSPGAGLAGAPSVAPAWEAGTDVRMLSLRLKSLQDQSAGVSWDEPPAQLGAAETGAGVPGGFDAVGTTTAPARVQVRMAPPNR